MGVGALIGKSFYVRARLLEGGGRGEEGDFAGQTRQE